MKTSLLKLAASVAVMLGMSAVQAANHPAFEVQASGQGKPMILIPGLASPGEVWKDTVARYSSQYRCYVLNLAGFAGVPATDGPLLQQAEEQLVQLIDAEKMDKPLIIGHSLGGFLALKTAAEHPEKVGRLVIVDTMPALMATQAPSMTETQMKEMAAQMQNAMQKADPAQLESRYRSNAATMVTKPEDIERIAGWGVKSDQKAVANAMAEMMGTDLRGEIGRITVPTLVLGTWVAYKQYVPRPAAEAVFRLQYAKLQGVQIELSDTSRHFIMYDDPQWMYARIDAFLR